MVAHVAHGVERREIICAIPFPIMFAGRVENALGVVRRSMAEERNGFVGLDTMLIKTLPPAGRMSASLSRIRVRFA